MFIKKIGSLLALGTVLWVSSCGVVWANDEAQAAPTGIPGLEARQIIILHTNDVHGRVGPEKGRGGLTKVASLVRQYRAEHPDCTIYLDAGDVAQGTPVSNIAKGAPTFASIASLKPAVGTIGNHEFDWGPERMRAMTTAAGYPFVLANVCDPVSGQTIFEPYKIIEVNGIKLGIIGLIGQGTPNIVKKGNTGDYVFSDIAETMRRYIPEMRQEGAQLIVALSHCGVEEDKKLAAAVPEIDVIVGGHSHTAIDPIINVDGHTWIVQSGSYARNLGVLDLSVSPFNGKILSAHSELISTDKDPQLLPDPEVSEILRKYEEQIRPQMEVVVAHLASDLSKQIGDECQDCPLGNAICESMRVKTGADVAFYNYGGIRVDKLRAGEVTRGDIYSLLPFDDAVTVLEIKGSAIQELLNQMASVQGVGPMQCSGLTCTLDKTQGIARDIMIGEQPLDPEKVYRLATTEFLSTGGDGYKAMTQGKAVELGDFGRDVFTEYISRQNPFPIPATGNVKVVR